MLICFAAFARRTACLALLLLAALPAGQLAAEGRSWIADANAEATWIIYGTAESDDVLLSVVCEKATKMVVVWFATEPTSGTTPATLPMELASEGGSVSLDGKGGRSEMDDAFSLEAKTTLTPELEKLLSQAKTLTVKIGGRKSDMALDDAAANGAQDIIKGCRN